VDNFSENPLGGDQNETQPVDIAKAALSGARDIAKGPRRGPSAEGKRRNRQANLAGRTSSGGYSGPRPDAVDPQRVGDVMSGYVDEQGWDRPITQARVFTDWERLVGPDIAAHCTPTALVDGELRVAAESTAWATQLRLLSSKLTARLVAELGSDVITKLVVSGPVAPSWKHGGFSVRGARGPRDTYG
jgi:predicted nucleic acid-binding Zn ribbon protein